MSDSNFSSHENYNIFSGSEEIVEMLLENGADINVIDMKNNTVLHSAASHSKVWFILGTETFLFNFSQQIIMEL